MFRDLLWIKRIETAEVKKMRLFIPGIYVPIDHPYITIMQIPVSYIVSGIPQYECVCKEPWDKVYPFLVDEQPLLKIDPAMMR
jgi:hypothetical protein